MYVDPSGYGWLSWLGKIIGGIAGAIAGYFGGPAAGMAVFSAISAGFSAMDSGANVWQAMGVAAVAGVAGYVGGAVGSWYGGVCEAGAWGTSLLSGAFAGASGGATGALLTGGNAGMGALSGAASGATMGAFSGINGTLGEALGPMFGAPIAGVAGAAVSGGNLGEGALSGAASWYGNVITKTITNATEKWQHRAKIRKESRQLTEHAINYMENEQNLTTDESIQVAWKGRDYLLAIVKGMFYGAAGSNAWAGINKIEQDTAEARQLGENAFLQYKYEVYGIDDGFMREPGLTPEQVMQFHFNQRNLIDFKNDANY